MISRAGALGRVVVCGLALPVAAFAAETAGEFQPTQVSASPDRSTGLKAFAQIERKDRMVCTKHRACCLHGCRARDRFQTKNDLAHACPG